MSVRPGSARASLRRRCRPPVQRLEECCAEWRHPQSRLLRPHYSALQRRVSTAPKGGPFPASPEGATAPAGPALPPVGRQLMSGN
eukprot:11712141-Alexandrium_andersonii.AAC.1